MYNQIVYGSLLDPKELEKHEISMDRVKFVKVKNFKRVFNQEPSWRKVESNNRAVMNIESDQSCWFNALLIEGVSQKQVEELDHRERGYDRVNIPDGDVIEYGSGKIMKNCIVYKGKIDKQNHEILPNLDYFDICKNGAESYSEEFYADYMTTTYKNSNNGLVKI
jgi:hypothetical protein